MLLTVLGLFGSVSAQSSATLNVSPTDAVVGQLVTATYSSYDSPDVTQIDWGDASGTENHPNGGGSATHTYSKVGTFIVNLIEDGRPVARQLVRVSEATTCEITAAPNPATPNQTVNFTIKFTGPANSKYGLYYGDGSNDNFGVGGTKSVSFKHSYQQPDTAVAVVIDLANQSPICRLIVNVAYAQVTLSLDPSPASVGQQVTATLGNLASDRTYTLDWGDGTTSSVNGSTTTLKHSYAAPGVFLVQLLRDGTLATVSITIRAPASTLSADPNPALALQDVTASMGNLLPGLPYTLDWGDSITVPITGVNGKATAKHAYSATGVFVVKLSADGVAPVTVSVTVKAPGYEIGISPNPAAVGEEVTATMKKLLPSLPYTLTWGDGTTVPVNADSKGNAVAKHKYAAPGVFIFNLTADGIAGLPTPITIRVPTPTLSVDPNPAEVNQTVTAHFGNGVPGVAYSVDWGDGTSDPVQGSGNVQTSAQHKYSAPGIYIVKYGVVGGAPVTVSLTVRAPVPTLSLDPNPALVGQQVTANMGNLLPNLPYSLDWGDGSVVPVTGNGKATAKHAYNSPGVFVVKLSADGVAPVTVSLNVRPPIPTLSLDPNPALVGQQVTANMGNLISNLPYSLDWGDGSVVPVTGNGQATAKHAYNSPGVFVVKLSADGVAPVTVSLNVRPPIPTLSLDPNPALVGQQVTANMGNLLSNLPYSLDWGDGTTVPVTGNGKASAKHAYPVPGVYIVKLSADGVTPVTATLKVNAPTATLSLDPNPALVGQQVTATLGSLVPSYAYSLDWGDGATSPVSGTTTNAKHSYTAPGTYLVKLLHDGSAPVTASLSVRAPTPTLSADPNPAIVGQDVTASLGNLISNFPYSLDWGDGSVVPVTGNGKATAKHKYAAPGVFIVKLSADGIAPVTVSLNVRPPAAGLTVDPNPAIVGQDVTATLASLLPNYPYSLDWGDGSVVPVTGNGKATAKHKYAAPGVFVVKLSADGIAPVTVSLNVRPPAAGLTVDPNPAIVGQDVTASMSSLLPSYPYSLDWGDGTVVPVTGNGAPPPSTSTPRPASSSSSSLLTV